MNPLPLKAKTVGASSFCAFLMYSIIKTAQAILDYCSLILVFEYTANLNLHDFVCLRIVQYIELQNVNFQTIEEVICTIESGVSNMYCIGALYIVIFVGNIFRGIGGQTSSNVKNCNCLRFTYFS